MRPARTRPAPRSRATRKPDGGLRVAVEALREQLAALTEIVGDLQRQRDEANRPPGSPGSDAVVPRRGLPFEEDVILAQERFEPAQWARPLAEQVRLLREVYLCEPALVVDEGYLAARQAEPLPRGHARVVVPKLAHLARVCGLEAPYAHIGVLVEHVCVLLDRQREGKFTHYRKGQLGPDRVQAIPALVERRVALEEGVPGDVLVLDVDLGNAYAGWTPRRARGHILHRPGELALSSVDVGWILLLNPDRFGRNVDLSVDSVMEEYRSEDRGWVTVLFFYHRGGKLEFGYRWNRRAYFDSGAAVARIG